MTIAQAERICGYRIERLSQVRAKVAEFAAYDDVGKLLAKAESRQGEKVALNMVIGKLYTLGGNDLYTGQKRLCNDCGRLLKRWEMHQHHIIPRSRGRRDRGNLIGLCYACHEKRHRENRL